MAKDKKKSHRSDVQLVASSLAKSYAFIDLEREEFNIYSEVGQFIPSMKPLDLSSKIETVVKVADKVVEVAPIVSPIALAINPVVGATVVGAINLLSPLISKVLRPLSQQIEVKDRIVNSINSQIALFNSGFKDDVSRERRHYTKVFNQIHKRYHKHSDMTADELSAYTAECRDAKKNFLDSIVDAYVAQSDTLQTGVLDALSETAKSLNANNTTVSVVRVAADYLISTAKASMKKGLEKVLGHATDVEVGKLHLNKEAQEILAKYDLPYDESLNASEKRSVMATIAEKCDRHEITVLMLVALESKKESDAEVEKPKFYGFDYLLDIGCDKLDEIRKSKCGKNGFELSGGAFEKMLDTPHPKALARMLSSHAAKDQVKTGVELYQENDKAGISMLEKMPFSSWGKFDTLSKTMEERDSRSTIGRSLTDFANKIANIFNNLFKRGVKDVALDEAVKNFAQVMHHSAEKEIDKVPHHRSDKHHVKSSVRPSHTSSTHTR